MKRYLFVLFVLLIPSCLGCLMPMSAKQLAGYTEPETMVKKKGSDWIFRASSDFAGKAKVNAKGDGEYTFEVDMTSASSPVTQAQGDRAEQLVELRRVEAAIVLETHKLWSQTLTSIVPSVLTAIAPLLVPKPPEPPQPPGPTIPEILGPFLPPAPPR